MKNNSNNSSNYSEARARWAREQAELFLNTLEKAGATIGISITPMQYVQAYKLCIEDYSFGYPAECKIAELISTEETYERTLDVMAAMMKAFRVEFHKTRKKRNSRRRKKAA